MKTILIVSLVCVFVYGSVMLVRNEWVFKNRRRLSGTPDYGKLPSYGEMMRKWWVWDIRKFIQR